jgi:hypothetical protein
MRALIVSFIALVTTVVIWTAYWEYSDDALEKAYSHNAEIRKKLLGLIDVERLWPDKRLAQVCLVHFTSDMAELKRYVKNDVTLRLPYWRPVGDEAITLLFEFDDGNSDYVVIRLGEAALMTANSRYLPCFSANKLIFSRNKYSVQIEIRN